MELTPSKLSDLCPVSGIGKGTSYLQKCLFKSPAKASSSKDRSFSPTKTALATSVDSGGGPVSTSQI